jgi:hypothetical protein
MLFGVGLIVVPADVLYALSKFQFGACTPCD